MPSILTGPMSGLRRGHRGPKVTNAAPGSKTSEVRGLGTWSLDVYVVHVHIIFYVHILYMYRFSILMILVH